VNAFALAIWPIWPTAAVLASLPTTLPIQRRMFARCTISTRVACEEAQPPASFVPSLAMTSHSIYMAMAVLGQHET
jgi:hypothetical protein